MIVRRAHDPDAHRLNIRKSCFRRATADWIREIVEIQEGAFHVGKRYIRVAEMLNQTLEIWIGELRDRVANDDVAHARECEWFLDLHSEVLKFRRQSIALRRGAYAGGWPTVFLRVGDHRETRRDRIHGQENRNPG